MSLGQCLVPTEWDASVCSHYCPCYAQLPLWSENLLMSLSSLMSSLHSVCYRQTPFHLFPEYDTKMNNHRMTWGLPTSPLEESRERRSALRWHEPVGDSERVRAQVVSVPQRPLEVCCRERGSGGSATLWACCPPPQSTHVDLNYSSTAVAQLPGRPSDTTEQWGVWVGRTWVKSAAQQLWGTRQHPEGSQSEAERTLSPRVPNSQVVNCSQIWVGGGRQNKPQLDL